MMFSPRRMLAVARKEFRHLARDPRIRPLLVVAPIMQMIILGFAANLDVENVQVLVVDHDRSPVSRAITERLDANSAFEVTGTTGDEGLAEAEMLAGRTEIVVLVPRGTDRRLARGQAAPIPLWVDGTDTNRGLLAQGYAERILGRISRELAPIPAEARVSRPAGPDVRVRVLYNPALQSRWFMLPAIVVMVLALITTLLSALAIVKERENGTIEQLSVTPVRPAELIVGKLLPFVAHGALVATATGAVAVFGFGVPFRGSLLDLVAMGLLFIMSMLGLGLFASTASGTQQQAMLSALLILLPSFLLGGIMYPISNMPEWAQWIADFSPIRYFAAMVRGVFVKGVGFESLLWETSMLALLGAVVLTLAMFTFRKRSA